MNRERVLAGGAAALIAAALLGSHASLRAQAPYGTSGASSGPLGITASGQGTASLPPDKALISASVQTDATASADALSQNSQTVQAALAAIRALGVSDANIQTTQLTLYPIYPNQAYNPSTQLSPPSSVSYFRASEGVGVTITDLSKVPSVVQALVSAGITQFSGIQYSWQDPEQIRVMALQAASTDAQQEAQALAGSLGVSLGQVLTSSVLYSSAPPVPYLAGPASAGFGAVPALPTTVAIPIQPGQQSANASVSITYAIAGR